MEHGNTTLPSLCVFPRPIITHILNNPNDKHFGAFSVSSDQHRTYCNFKGFLQNSVIVGRDVSYTGKNNKTITGGKV